jgi:hypothetical protein
MGADPALKLGSSRAFAIAIRPAERICDKEEDHILQYLVAVLLVFALDQVDQTFQARGAGQLARSSLRPH